MKIVKISFIPPQGYVRYLNSFPFSIFFDENKVMNSDFIKKVLNVRLKIEEHKLNVQFCYVM